MSIFRLNNDLDKWIDILEGINSLLLSSFKTRFASASPGHRVLDLSFIQPILNDQDGLTLLAPFSDEEIKNVFIDMNPHKALGSDGFGPKFFQAYWPIVGPEVCLAIHGFFHHGCLPPSLNHTMIAPIPKQSSPETPNHFRPISLINSIYKAISKLMVQRLCPILKNAHQPPLQNASTPDRSIHDNILIVQEILTSFQKSSTKIGWCALELDMEKAYDHTEWDFLWQTLSKLGFPPRWIHWVKQTVTTVSYSLKVNG